MKFKIATSQQEFKELDLIRKKIIEIVHRPYKRLNEAIERMYEFAREFPSDEHMLIYQYYRAIKRGDEEALKGFLRIFEVGLLSEIAPFLWEAALLSEKRFYPRSSLEKNIKNICGYIKTVARNLLKKEKIKDRSIRHKKRRYTIKDLQKLYPDIEEFRAKDKPLKDILESIKEKHPFVYDCIVSPPRTDFRDKSLVPTRIDVEEDGDMPEDLNLVELSMSIEQIVTKSKSIEPSRKEDVIKLLKVYCLCGATRADSHILLGCDPKHAAALWKYLDRNASNLIKKLDKHDFF
jgi:hypothetical protein